MKKHTIEFKYSYLLIRGREIYKSDNLPYPAIMLFYVCTGKQSLEKTQELIQTDPDKEGRNPMAHLKSFPAIDMKATGANILKLRQNSGYSISQLQAYFNFDAPQAIYKWQRGDSIPSTDNLLALSCLLEVPIEEILIYHIPGDETTPQDPSCGGPCFWVKFRV